MAFPFGLESRVIPVTRLMRLSCTNPATCQSFTNNGMTTNLTMNLSKPIVFVSRIIKATGVIWIAGEIGTFWLHSFPNTNTFNFALLNFNRNYVCERPLSYHPFWDQASLDSKTQEAVDYIFDTIYHHEENCAEEPEEPEGPEGPEEPETPGPAFRFLIFGGFNEFERVQESVWLIDLETNTSCLHSNMPDGLKEPFVYELQNGELMVCSAFTEMDKSNLNCWTWSPLRGWQELGKHFEIFNFAKYTFIFAV